MIKQTDHHQPIMILDIFLVFRSPKLSFRAAMGLEGTERHVPNGEANGVLLTSRSPWRNPTEMIFSFMDVFSGREKTEKYRHKWRL